MGCREYLPPKMKIWSGLGTLSYMLLRIPPRPQHFGQEHGGNGFVETNGYIPHGYRLVVSLNDTEVNLVTIFAQCIISYYHNMDVFLVVCVFWGEIVTSLTNITGLSTISGFVLLSHREIFTSVGDKDRSPRESHLLSESIVFSARLQLSLFLKQNFYI